MILDYLIVCHRIRTAAEAESRQKSCVATMAILNLADKSAETPQAERILAHRQKKERQPFELSLFVGVPGFEPGTLWSQTRCANRTALHPVAVLRVQR